MRHLCFEEKGWSKHQEAWRASERGLCSQALPGQRLAAHEVAARERCMDLGKRCHLTEHSAPRHVPAEMHMCGENGTFFHSQWDCKLVQPLQKSVWRIPKKLSVNLPNEPAIHSLI